MSEWKGILQEVAPTVAGMVAGPLAAMGMNLLSGVLGVEQDERKIGDIVASGDPEILLKLRDAERQAEIELQRLGIEKDRLHLDNTDSARSLAKDQGLKAQYILSATFIGGYFVIFAGFVYALVQQVGIDPAFATLFSALLGIMTMAVKDIINFWFGSSLGSKEKTAASNRQVEKMLLAMEHSAKQSKGATG